MSYAHLSAQQKSVLCATSSSSRVHISRGENLTNIFRNNLHGGSHMAPSIGTSKLRGLQLLPELTHRSVSSVKGSDK